MDARTQELPLAESGQSKPIAQVGPASKPIAQSGPPQFQPEQNFDWSPDNPDVVMPEQPATAVYLNRWGQAVIRQQRDWDDEEDTYVRINLHHVQALIDALQAVMQAQ